jgi:hypothetical protein
MPTLMIIHRHSDLEAVGSADPEARARPWACWPTALPRSRTAKNHRRPAHATQVLELSVTERGELPDPARESKDSAESVSARSSCAS